MKMVKKILLGLALAGTVLALAGCSMGDDKQMEKEGNKWDFTATIDHINIDAKKGTKYTTDKLYRRAWTQLGNKESVSKLKTTITISTDVIKEKSTLASNAAAVEAAKALYPKDETLKDITKNPTEEENKFYTISTSGTEQKAVVGFLFDLHKSTVKVDGKDATVFDFILLGFRPATREYYVERYYNVPKDAMENPTSLGSIWKNASSYCVSLDGKTSGAYNPTAIPANKVKTETKDGKSTMSFDITVTQANGKYHLSFCGVELDITNTTGRQTGNDKDGTLRGGAGVYANAPLGTIATINSHVDKDNTEGLYEEVEE